MKNAYVLNFNDQFIKDGVEFNNDIPDTWQTIKLSPYPYLTDAGKEYLQKIKVYASFLSSVFIGPPNQMQNIHADKAQFKRPFSYAINYVWGAKSTMRWYDPLSEGIPGLTNANTVYHTFHEHQVELIEEIEFPLNKLVLVRVDIPHMVNNYSSSRRYCLSLRSYPYLHWEDIVEHLRPHFVEEGGRIELQPL